MLHKPTASNVLPLIVALLFKLAFFTLIKTQQKTSVIINVTDAAYLLSCPV